MEYLQRICSSTPVSVAVFGHYILYKTTQGTEEMALTSHCDSSRPRLSTLLHNCSTYLFTWLFCLLISQSGVQAEDSIWPGVAYSKDTTPISFQSYGSGKPTLIFVHGWSCDSRYWHQQIPYFSRNNQVITIDLAGHGHSGLSRTRYSMRAFGEDVLSVIEKTGSNEVILIGHSMGGLVIAEAALLAPERIIGLIGVDTFGDIEYPLTREELEKMITALQTDFANGSRQFVESMILPQTDPLLREWILADMAAAPKNVALSAFVELMGQYLSGEAATKFEKIKAPVVTVNADLWPINYEANRRHMSSFKAIVLQESDHFLMMNRSDDFNRALAKAIDSIIKKRSK